MIGALLCRLGVHQWTIVDVVPMGISLSGRSWRWAMRCRREGCRASRVFTEIG